MTDFLQILNTPWWVEIITAQPKCTYYFGPFSNLAEAEAACPGYFEDLESEGSQVIEVIIKRCQPDKLTICHEEVA
jgi:hypothetical protein